MQKVSSLISPCGLHAASHQGLRCLLEGISVRNILNIEINILDIPNFGNKLIQLRRMEVMDWSNWEGWKKWINIHTLNEIIKWNVHFVSVYSAERFTHLCLVDSPILLNWINLFSKLGMSTVFISIFRLFLTEIPSSKQRRLRWDAAACGVSSGSTSFAKPFF